MNTQDKNLALVIKELHKAFDCLNKEFYGNKLPQVIISIQSKGKRSVYGWFTIGKVWDDGTQSKHEINFSAEHINREFLEIMRTLHHEMIHLYCHINNIKDTSRSGNYHNSNFKKISEQHGFYYKEDAFDKKLGWNFSTLTDESISKIKNFGLDETIFSLKRYDFSKTGNKEKKKSNIIKWQCGCGQIVRSSKDGLNIICGDCGTKFEKEEDINTGDDE